MRKLAIWAFSFSGAVFLGHYLFPPKWLLPAAAILMLLFVASMLLKGDKKLVTALVLSGTALGFVFCFFSWSTRLAPAQEMDKIELQIRAEVTDYPSGDTEYSSVPISLKTEGLPKLRAILYVYDNSVIQLVPGDIIEAGVYITSADTQMGKRYHGYNSQGIYLRCRLQGELEVLETGRSFPAYFPKRVARAVVTTAKRVFSDDATPFMTALLIGEKEELYEDDSLYVTLSEAGILHVIAVSGMHVGFLIGFLMLIIRRKKWASLIGIPLVWFFAAMAGAPPSVVRAAFMQSMVLIAPLLRRENDGITSLSAALAFILILSPDACASIGLQLSFGAMLGIVTLTPRIYGAIYDRYRQKRGKKTGFFAKAGQRLVLAIVAAFAASVGAQVFSLPIAALYFGYIPLYGVLVNIIIFWAVSAAFISGYLACLLGMIWLPLGIAPGWLGDVFSAFILGVSRLFSGLPNAAVYTRGNIFGLWMVLSYVVFLLFYAFRGKRGVRPLLPVCISVCGFCVVVIVTALFPQGQGGRVTAVNVGQGQCIIMTRGNTSVMVDCGGNLPRENAGDKAASLLFSSGRRRVDALILTHFDRDHANGVIRLMNRVEVKRLLVPPDDGDTTLSREIIEQAKRLGIEVNIIENDTLVEMDEMSLSVYGPVSRIEPCLMILGTMGDFDVLVTGDADIELEERFLMTHELPDTELFIAGHHGSLHSSGKAILDAAKAEKAIVSCGYNNYGHPSDEVLKRLRSANMEVYITEEIGTITVPIDK